MPELWARDGSGVNRKIKKLCTSVGGVNREIKELWTAKDGVNRKIFSAFPAVTAQVTKNYSESNGSYGSMTEESRINADCTGLYLYVRAKMPSGSVSRSIDATATIRILFSEPVAVTAGQEIYSISNFSFDEPDDEITKAFHVYNESTQQIWTTDTIYSSVSAPSDMEISMIEFYAHASASMHEDRDESRIGTITGNLAYLLGTPVSDFIPITVST